MLPAASVRSSIARRLGLPVGGIAPEDGQVEGVAEMVLGATHESEASLTLAHLWFVTIHPLDSGNGRIGRAVVDKAIAQAERSGQRFYSLSSVILRRRKGYYDILERAQKADLDITDWLIWFLEYHKGATEHAEHAAKQTTDIAQL